MANGTAKVYAEQDKVLTNDYLKITCKQTTSSSGTVVFTKSTDRDRYLAVLFIEENNSNSAFYLIGEKLNYGSGNFITKLAGTDHNITVDSSGSISVPLGTWSQCAILSTMRFD